MVVINETALDSRMIPLAGHVLRDYLLDCFHGNQSWHQTLIATIATSGAIVTAWHEERVYGSTLFDLFSRLDFASGTCSIMDNTAFRKIRHRMERHALPCAAKRILVR